MDAGKRITDLPEMESVPAGTAYLAESGDGAGTRHIKFEKLAEAIGKLLKLGNMEKLTTKEKSSFVGALNEANKKAETVFTGTDGIKAGTAGLVPAPEPEDEGKVLGANGKWVPGGGSGGKGRLKTIEEIEANTEEGYDVDALLIKKFLGDVLWENPNPNSQFAAQDVILDLSEYSYIEIHYKESTGKEYIYITSKISKNTKVKLFTPNESDNTSMRIRNVSVEESKVNFSTCYYNDNTVALNKANNSGCIPIKIIGYKI